jgi:hypothetical protein
MIEGDKACIAVPCTAEVITACSGPIKRFPLLGIDDMGFIGDKGNPLLETLVAPEPVDCGMVSNNSVTISGNDSIATSSIS